MALTCCIHLHNVHWKIRENQSFNHAYPGFFGGPKLSQVCGSIGTPNRRLSHHWSGECLEHPCFFPTEIARPSVTTSTNWYSTSSDAIFEQCPHCLGLNIIYIYIYLSIVIIYIVIIYIYIVIKVKIIVTKDENMCMYIYILVIYIYIHIYMRDIMYTYIHMLCIWKYIHIHIRYLQPFQHFRSWRLSAALLLALIKLIFHLARSKRSTWGRDPLLNDQTIGKPWETLMKSMGNHIKKT